MTHHFSWFAIAVVVVGGCAKNIALENCPHGTDGDHCAPASTCGDGVCDASEVDSCPADCGGSDGAGPPDADGTATTVDGGSGTVTQTGTSTYAVTSVTGFGSYCIDLPDAVFGQVADTMTVDFETSGVFVNQGVEVAFDSKSFPVAQTTTSNLGGSVDVTTGMYESNDVFYFEDDQSSGSTPVFYYSVTFTRSGDSLEIDYKIPNPAGDVTCLLQKQ